MADPATQNSDSELKSLLIDPCIKMSIMSLGCNLMWLIAIAACCKLVVSSVDSISKDVKSHKPFDLTYMENLLGILIGLTPAILCSIYCCYPRGENRATVFGTLIKSFSECYSASQPSENTNTTVITV